MVGIKTELGYLCWCEMQVEGGVTAAKGFKAAGIYSGLRAKGEKPDLALVACDVDATVAGMHYELLWSLTCGMPQVAMSS